MWYDWNMKRIVGIILSFTLTALVAGFFSRFDVDPHHDGIFLKPAIDMVNGQRLFKDTFSIYGPGASVIHYGILSVFGESLIFLKLGTALVYGLIAGVLFYISTSILPVIISYGVIILWVAMAPYYEPNVTFFIWPSVYALFFQLVAIACFIAWEKNKKHPVLLVLSGASVAATVWLRMPVGGLLYGAFIFFFISKRTILKTNTFIFHFSFFIVHMSVLVNLLVSGVFREWFFQSVQFISWWHTAVLGERIFPIVFLEKMLPLSYGPVSVWVLFPFTALYVLWKRIQNSTVTLLAMVGLSSWAQYYPMNDIHHIYWAATPFFPILIWVVYSHFNSVKRGTLALCILFVLFIPDIYNRARMIRHKLRGEYVKILVPSILKGMLVRQNTYSEIQKQVNTISQFENTHPDGMVIATGPDVLYTTFAKNKQNCHPFTSNWGWEVYNKTFNDSYHAAIKKCVQNNKGGVLILSKKASTCSCED